jgi:hypothetical protein
VLVIRARKFFRKDDDTLDILLEEYTLIAKDTLGGVGALSCYRKLVVWIESARSVSEIPPSWVLLTRMKLIKAESK